MQNEWVCREVCKWEEKKEEETSDKREDGSKKKGEGTRKTNQSGK